MKRALVVVISVLIAGTAAMGASALDPQPAQAAGGGYVEQCGGGEIFLNDQEMQVLALHNQVRAEHGLEPLCVHPKLQEAACAHSQEMLDKDYAAHESFNGETVKQRLKRFGYGFSRYSYYAYGENIAWGSGPPYEAVIEGWMCSDGHRANIMRTDVGRVGIGVYKRGGQTWVTQIFIGRRVG